MPRFALRTGAAPEDRGLVRDQDRDPRRLERGHRAPADVGAHDGVDVERLVQQRAVLEGGGLLLIQEFILDATRTAPLFPALFSLNMLLGTPQGQAYSEPELGELLRQAGLTQVERLDIDLPNGAGIMVAYKQS